MRTWSNIVAALKSHRRCALVTQLAVEGSAPREAGARMIVMPGGQFTGTIGGGALEWHALAQAQRLLRKGKAAVEITRHALGPQMGQCCGGAVQLMIEVWTADRLEDAEVLAGAEAGGPFATEANIGNESVQRQISERGVAGTGQITWRDSDVLIEGFGHPDTPVYLFGAGHVGRALMLAMAPLPFEVVWIDTRREAFPAAVPGNVRLVASDDPAGELAAAPDGAFVVVMTHSHVLDLDICRRALSAGRFDYVGVIGSATKRARFRSRLRKAGLDQDVIDAMVCPIGIDGISSKHPAAIAAGVAAQFLQVSELVKNRQNPVQSGAGPVKLVQHGAEGIAKHG